jgi:hypothetical protein
MARSWVPLGTSTGVMAQFVWCARLFYLESVLPKVEYKVLGWECRNAFKRDLIGWLDEVRNPYLMYGSMSVIGGFNSIYYVIMIPSICRRFTGGYRWLQALIGAYRRPIIYKASISVRKCLQILQTTWKTTWKVP